MTPPNGSYSDGQTDHVTDHPSKHVAAELVLAIAEPDLVRQLDHAGTHEPDRSPDDGRPVIGAGDKAIHAGVHNQRRGVIDVDLVTVATITLADRENPVQAERALTISAVNAGRWGNDLDISILDSTVDPVNEFKLVVKYRSDTVEAFDNLSMDPARANFVENVIQGSSQYITVKAVSTAQTREIINPVKAPINNPFPETTALRAAMTRKCITAAPMKVSGIFIFFGFLSRWSSFAQILPNKSGECQSAPRTNDSRVTTATGSQ